MQWLANACVAAREIMGKFSGEFEAGANAKTYVEGAGNK